MTYFAELRDLRSKLEEVEASLERLATEREKMFAEVVFDFNEIYREHTSEYHLENVLKLEIA